MNRGISRINLDSARPAKLLIVGVEAESNVGGSFLRAAADLGVSAGLLNQQQAFNGPVFWRKLCWHFGGRRAPRQKWFSGLVEETVRQQQASLVLFTGQSPVCPSLLRKLDEFQIKSVVYLTDDPFNPTHRCRWFLELLRSFSGVFTTRRANLGDLVGLGLKRVEYLPFGVDKHLFYPPPQSASFDQEADVFFAGGADAERARLMGALDQAGLKLALYGSYWERYPETRMLGRGQCSVVQLREAAWRAKVGLCVVRKANRDGHCMRTFELPALGSCMLVEYTDEHREIFGEDGQTVCYFRSTSEMVARAQWLRDNVAERSRLGSAVHQWIARGGHTYSDRLGTIIKTMETAGAAKTTLGFGNNNQAEAN